MGITCTQLQPVAHARDSARTRSSQSRCSRRARPHKVTGMRASPPLAQSLRSDRRAADYVFVEEWVDQRSVDAHLKWAKPIVETEWKSLTESTEFLGFNPDTVG